jgi:hypothetical protein
VTVQLLPTQRDAVFNDVTTLGFNPSDFVWAMDALSGDDILEYRSSPYFRFQFEDGNSVGHRIGRYSPGGELVEQRVGAHSWAEQRSQLQQWLGHLRRELDAPDLWAQARANQVLEPSRYQGG